MKDQQSPSTAAQNLIASRSAKRPAQALTPYAHRRAGVDFHDPNFHYRAYDPWIAYGQSKTANSLFAVALDSIGRRRGVRAFAVHPGGIVTGLIRHMSKAEIDAGEILDESGKPIIDPERTTMHDRRLGEHDRSDSSSTRAAIESSQIRTEASLSAQMRA